MSSTKLTAYQKDYLKILREQQKGENFAVVQTADKLVTVAVWAKPGHNCAQVAVSIASPEEQKARRKVGEYVARYNLAQGKSIPFRMDSAGEDNAVSMARMFVSCNFGENDLVIL